jgi:hypothetical protein
MSKQQQDTFSMPQTFSGIPGFSKESFEALSEVFSESVRNGNRIQAELLRFVGDRFSKDVALISRLAACKEPTAFLNLQSELVTGLTNDYLQEGAKIFALASEVAKENFGKFAKAATPPK